MEGDIIYRPAITLFCFNTKGELSKLLLLCVLDVCDSIAYGLNLLSV